MRHLRSLAMGALALATIPAGVLLGAACQGSEPGQTITIHNNVSRSVHLTISGDDFYAALDFEPCSACSTEGVACPGEGAPKERVRLSPGIYRLSGNGNTSLIAIIKTRWGYGLTLDEPEPLPEASSDRELVIRVTEQGIDDGKWLLEDVFCLR